MMVSVSRTISTTSGTMMVTQVEPISPPMLTLGIGLVVVGTALVVVGEIVFVIIVSEVVVMASPA